MSVNEKILPLSKFVSPARRRIRIRILLILCIMYAIAYIDRTNISTAAPIMQHYFGFSSATMGVIFSAFSIPYALLQIFGGTFGQKLGPRKALAFVAILWGIATLATGWAVGFLSLFGARLLLGLSESAAFPTATQAMSRWIPVEKNGFAQGIVHSASRIGGAIAPLIVAALIVWGGWRTAFFATGVLSILWAILWYTMFRNQPSEHKSVSDDELAELSAPQRTVEKKAIPWKRLIKSIAPVTFVDFGYGWMLWVFITWLPTFLSSEYHVSLAKFALYTSLILCAGVIGDTLGGVLSDRLIRTFNNVRKARRTAILIGLIGSAMCLLPLLSAHDAITATVCLALSFFFLEIANAPLWSIPMDVAPEWAGTASGMMNTGFGIAGVISPIVFGVLITKVGWQLPFAISIGLLIAAALVAAIMKPQLVSSKA